MLSHFCHRRKELNIDKFEKIFEKFDIEIDPQKEHKKISLKKVTKNINKGYTEDTVNE